MQKKSLAPLEIVSQTVPLDLTNPLSTFQLTFFLPQTGRSSLGGERDRPPLKYGQRPNICSQKLGLIGWRWFSLLEHRQFRISSGYEVLLGFLLFSCLGVRNFSIGRTP